MKKYVYSVSNFEFVDTIPFGMAWKQAKAKAAELHTMIYRQILKDEYTAPRYEVYTTACVFLYIEYVKPEMIKIF